ncbi:MAG: hypothetical protein KF773_42655 [Deltaproteobacteria bacterium]|nr:hypothetical protein [Deltaproteobacteria bacterium]MCW5806897.1 hypothetical protein [Deltaproteobacteria bacterium]
MRQRSQTIGTLGRAPARQSSPQPVTPVPPREPDRDDAGPGPLRRWMRGAIFDNPGLKFLSLILAVTVFLLVSTDKDREITVRVPVKYDYPADKVLVSGVLEEVTLTIKGPWRVLQRFDDRELGRIRLDLMSATTSGEFEVAITPDLVTQLPPRLTVTSMTPKSVRVQFDKKIEKLVAVVPSTTDHAQYGYKVFETKVTPPIVRVRGGEKSLQAVTSVSTADVDLADRRDTFDTQVGLAPPPGVELVEPKQRVSVHVRIEEALVIKTYTAQKVVVKLEGVDAAAPNAPKFTVDPEEVEVTLSGPTLAVDAAAKLPLVVRAGAADVRGARKADVVIEGLPPLVGHRISPERVTLTPVKPAAPAPTPPP